MAAIPRDLAAAWRDAEGTLQLFIRSRVANACDAQDLLHDVFVKATQSHRLLRDRRKIRAWIYQIARNAIVDYYRRRRNTEELPSDFPQLVRAKNPWEMASRCVGPFIAELPPMYRDALILSEIKGLDQAQVARRLGISLANAKARIRRGKQQLKQRFDDCCIFKLGPRKAEIESDTFGKEE